MATVTELPKVLNREREVDGKKVVTQCPLATSEFTKGDFKGLKYPHEDVEHMSFEQLKAFFGEEDLKDIILAKVQQNAQQAWYRSIESHTENEGAKDEKEVFDSWDIEYNLKLLSSGTVRGDTKSDLLDLREKLNNEIRAISTGEMLKAFMERNEAIVKACADKLKQKNAEITTIDENIKAIEAKWANRRKRGSVKNATTAPAAAPVAA